MVERRKRLQEYTEAAQQKNIAQYNKHTHKIPFKVGDKVLYKVHTAHKWDKKFSGPWVITKQVSPVTFQLNINGEPYSAHAKYLKLYRERAVEGAPEQEKEEVIVENSTESEDDEDNRDIILHNLPPSDEIGHPDEDVVMEELPPLTVDLDAEDEVVPRRRVINKAKSKPSWFTSDRFRRSLQPRLILEKLKIPTQTRGKARADTPIPETRPPGLRPRRILKGTQNDDFIYE